MFQGSNEIDIDANNFVDYIRDNADKLTLDEELVGKSINFVTRLVGSSSRNPDEETGLVEVAKFDMTNGHDSVLDQLGVEFLQKVGVSQVELKRLMTQRLQYTLSPNCVRAVKYLKSRFTVLN